MQYLLLARHGNTFAAGEKALWVGARNDLPLVQTGIEQAQTLANNLKKAVLMPQAIYCGPLVRTKAYAQIINDDLHLGLAITIDKRLNEIDYGSWSGLSNEEIEAQFGSLELNNWSKFGKWPQSFANNENEIEVDVQSFVADVIESKPAKKVVLTVSSNGRLKYFLKLMPAVYADYLRQSNWKVSTGNICLLSYEDKNWQLICWNAKPEVLSALRINLE